MQQNTKTVVGKVFPATVTCCSRNDFEVRTLNSLYKGHFLKCKLLKHAQCFYNLETDLLTGRRTCSRKESFEFVCSKSVIYVIELSVLSNETNAADTIRQMPEQNFTLSKLLNLPFLASSLFCTEDVRVLQQSRQLYVATDV